MGEKLEIEFGVKNAALRSGLADAKAEIGKWRAQVGGVFASALAVGGIIQGARAVMDYAAQINDLSAKFGVATDTLQRWGVAAETNASSAGAMAEAFNKLIIAQSKANQGDSQMIEDFERLGVTMHELQTLDAEGLMRKIGEGSLEAANVTGVLGRSALELVPALKAVADGSADLGMAIEEGTIRSLGAAADKMKEYQHSMVIAGGSIATFGIQMTEGLKGVWKSVTKDREAMSPIDLLKSIWDDASTILAEQMSAEEDQRTARKVGNQQEKADLEKLGSLREKIANIQEKATDVQMEKVDQLAALETKIAALEQERAKMGEGTVEGLEKQVEIEQVKLEIIRLYHSIQDDVIAQTEKEIAAREQAAEQAAKERQQREEDAKEGARTLEYETRRLAILREETAGREQVADQMRRTLEHEEKLKDLEEQIVTARKNGNNGLATTLTRLRGVIIEQANLTNSAAAEATARNGGQSPTTTQLRRQARAQQKKEKKLERFNARLVDGAIPTRRDISGRPTHGIDVLTGEERPINDPRARPPLNVFKNPDPRNRNMPAQPPGNGAGGGDLRKPGAPGAVNPNSEVVQKLEELKSELREFKLKVVPLDIG